MHPFSNGYLGKPIVYDGKLHLRYSDNGRNSDLMIWDGSMFTPIESPMGYENSLRGYFSSTSIPFIFNGKLYLQYRDNSSNEDLFVWNGSTLTPIPSPSGYDTDGGYSGNPIIYNGALYLHYENNNETGVLAKLLTCESPGSTVTVTTTDDVVDGDVSSIANLIATPGADGFISLREAISAANNTPGADEILFDPSTDGTPFVLDIGSSNEDINADGDLDITGCGGLTITGNGATNTIIDGNMTERVFHHREGNLTISGVTVQNGNADESGGGLRSSKLESMVNLSNCIFDSNTATESGGGAAFFGSREKVFIMNCQFTNNQATDSGGAIYTSKTEGEVTISNSQFINNKAEDTGGIDLQGTREVMYLTNSTIANNMATDGYGGGMSVDGVGAKLFMNGTTLSGNMATTYGGGIAVRGFSTESMLTNMTISGNRANTNGGGLAALTSSNIMINLNFVTITENIADDDNNDDGNGGGIYIENSSTNNINIQNSILQGNADKSTPSSDDCATAGSSTITSLGGNVFGDNTGCSPGMNDTTDDADLLPLADNGGFTQTHALGCNSAAIDFAVCGDVDIDQRGEARNDGACDAGAFEAYQSSGVPITVTTNNDVVDGDITSIANLIATPGADGFISLREAISAANNTLGADEIVFDPITNGTPLCWTLAPPMKMPMPMATSTSLAARARPSRATDRPILSSMAI
ncbi:MAG: hypothetical protein IPJ74_08270 [Saprospiraceae bacterium]|nr:hypothetical protein [Saprospiraceae bacterium]